MTRPLVRVTLLVALGNVVLTCAVLWGLGALGASAARPAGTPSMATQRVAEAIANDAFRSVITHDYAALNVIIRQTATWPELVYVSVEDAQGRILAHSEPARVGQTWSAAVAANIRSTVKVAYDDIVAAIADPTGDPRVRAPIGRVRLGFMADASVPAVPNPLPPPWVALGTAVALSLPIALMITRLGRRAPPEAEPEQVTRLLRDLKEAATEAQRLRSEQARAAEEVSRLQRERTVLSQELQRLEEQAGGEPAAAAYGREEAEAPRTGFEHGQPTPGATAVAASATHTPVRNDGDTAREAQHRAVAHICQAFRHSLTTILGFSRLLLRNVDGGLNSHQRTDVEHIQHAGEELLAFITSLAELARADLGSLPGRPESLELAHLLTQAAQMPDVAARVQVRLDAEKAPPVQADPAQVGRALHLLLQHAVADAPQGRVVATVRHRGSVTAVEVAYSRPALAPAEVERLFDPFGPGSGNDAARVRLALARALAALNGGALSVAPGEQSLTFMLALPPNGGRAHDPPGEPADRTQETAQR